MLLTIITIVVIVGIGATIYYILKRNNADRKENLNIIHEGKKIYFYLSDDFFFSVDLEKNRKLGETITRVINKEMDYLIKCVRKINFINFENKPLEEFLNSMLNLKRG
ncbi:MAG: hypothetical protein GXO60_09885 [Epsilonproteobacteria bacterium]|nr:hypothetical protein [Campylobacterota bacterium]